ncbi:structural maintenance of chromosomes protein 1A-like [Lampetra planeri]
MGYLQLIEVENFKSYQGKQIIGPFTRFSAVIGPNGSGKSNLMDAISFVLGEQKRNLRVRSLRDLVYGAPVGRPVANRTHVSMIYAEEGGSHTVFTRTIIGSTSEYRVDKRVLNFNEYSAQLAKRGILTKARNFLVFQGAVESIAMKTPKERTWLFEQISQSGELAAEYEQCKTAMLKANEDTQFNYHCKRNITAERKEARLEKEEAENYRHLRDELASAHTQLYLFLLYQNEQQMNLLENELAGVGDQLNQQCALISTTDDELRVRKQEIGRLGRELQQVEKAIKAKEMDLGQSRPQYIKVKENISHRLRRMESARQSLQNARTEWVRRKKDIDELERELVAVERARQDFEQLVGTQSQSEDFEIDESQVQEYYCLKEEAGRRAGGMTQELETFKRAQKADQEHLELETRKMKETQSKVKQKQQEFEDQQNRIEKIKQYIEKTRSAIEELDVEQVSLTEQVEGARRRALEINDEVVSLTAQLGDARTEQHEDKRFKRRAEALDSLLRLFAGAIFGRLVNLCQPTHRKYQLAVTKVLGRNMEAIIVDTDSTARDCIRYLKEQRCEAEMFLPLDYLQVRPINERLRELRGAKLLMDVIKFDPPQVSRALQFACSNALVCETLEDARHIAFGGHVRQKCVSLDGTLFSKSGVVSGGSSDLKAKARRWDDKLVDKLREKKEQLLEELRVNLSIRRKEADLRQIQSQLHGMQTRLKYSQSDMEQTRVKLQASLQEKSKLESQLANLEPHMDEVREGMAARDNEAEEVTEKMNKLEDEVFKDFCVEAGVANIREFEEVKLKWREEVTKKGSEFDNQKTRLGIQLDYERMQLKQEQSKVKMWDAAIAKDEAEIDCVKKDEQRSRDGVEHLISEMHTLKNQLLAKQGEVTNKAQAAEEVRRKLLAFNRQAVQLQNEVTALETKLEQQRSTRHNLLLTCKLQDIKLPLRNGNMDSISQELGATQPESTTETGTSSEHTNSVYAREAAIEVDYRKLSRQYKDINREDEINHATDELNKQVTNLQTGMQRIVAPNMKATEKFENVRGKFLETAEALEESRKRSKQAQMAFNKVQRLRFDRFNGCLEHLSIAIDDIYKKLAQNNSAQAFLGPENAEEPYLDGINYNCVAPGKRYQPMDNLSGGEKTVAALALLFAIHSYRPSPFFVLDEIDAALDNTNIGKVANYIKEQSVENFQVIIISLKEELFARADALIGVYPEQGDCLISHVVTMDLSRFPDELSADRSHQRREHDSASVHSALSDNTFTPNSSLA